MIFLWKAEIFAERYLQCSFSLKVSCNITEISFCICWYHVEDRADKIKLSSATKAVLTFTELSSLNPAT